MSITEKLGLAKPGDLYARMTLTDSSGNVVEADGEEGWIEFWGPDSEASRRHKRNLSVEANMRSNAKTKKNAPYTRAQAEREVDEARARTVRFIVAHIRNWRLVSGSGELIDVPFSEEVATQLFSHPDYGFLADNAAAFLIDPENFSLPSSIN